MSNGDVEEEATTRQPLPRLPRGGGRPAAGEKVLSMLNDLDEGLIHEIIAREILDSRGNPTVEVDVILRGRRDWVGPWCPRARPPAPARRSSCATSRPSDSAARACARRCDHVNKVIAPALIGIEAVNQVFIDNAMIEMDGTREQVQAGRQRDARRLDRRRPRRGRVAGPAALPLPRRLQHQGPARCR